MLSIFFRKVHIKDILVVVPHLHFYSTSEVVLSIEVSHLLPVIGCKNGGLAVSWKA